MVPQKFQALKILQLIDSLHPGGAERMCVNIANVLHENGYEVQICASRKRGPLEKFIQPGLKYHILTKRNSFDIFAFYRFVAILKSQRIDIIHAHSSSVFWAVGAKFIVKNIKVIWHDHLGLRIYDRKKNFFYKLISTKIDGIISVNQELAEWSRQNMKVPTERIVMINNFPLLNSLEKRSDPEVFTIVCLANLRPQKDHPTLLRAIAQLKEMNLHKRLKVILAGSDDDQKYVGKLRVLISDLGLEEIIEMPGSVEDTSSLLASADCGVLTSVSEGLPVALLEYGLAELPVVVTNVGQCAEVVDYGKCGFLIEPGDFSQLAGYLKLLLLNTKLHQELGSKLKEQVMDLYSCNAFLQQYKKLLTYQ